jgi:hypothetical protein
VTSRTHEEIEVSPGHHVQVRLPPTHAITNVGGGEQAEQATTKRNESANSSPEDIKKDNQKKAAPVCELTVKPDEAAELERSISELTMRSSYAQTEGHLQKIPENRRMAYYAVGRHHRNTGRGGNRRCYFTGKLILGGAPFYAGSVLQGLRTLVVFCLPSALGLPDKETILKHGQYATAARMGSHATRSTTGSTSNGPRLLLPKSGTIATSGSRASASYATPPLHSSADTVTNRSSGGWRSRRSRNRVGSAGASIASQSYASKSHSRISSLDDLSLSIDGDLDPNWSLDRNFLLSVLPAADEELLNQMATLYPEQFETLPVQVRDASRWKLYVKFCFFSGLPISEGEMHYKVRDDIADQVYGEEIVLSHDVMEAATGASAEILTLPNRTVIRYLRKHYAQQCSKLDDRVFQRANWERVAPEV